MERASTDLEEHRLVCRFAADRDHLNGLAQL
jgi:hypothetical protein